MYTDEDLLALSGLQHIAYCERQWALIHIEAQWSENYDTVRGDIFHERAHTKGYSVDRGVRAERGMRLVNYHLGITGVADIVEFIDDDQGTASSAKRSYILHPVEYKVGKPKVEDWDRVQLCAQALCLEEMYGCRIDAGSLFYGETRRREAIVLDDDLRQHVSSLAQRMHNLFSASKTPRASKSARCKRCSLIDVCLPEVFSFETEEYWRHEGFLWSEA